MMGKFEPFSVALHGQHLVEASAGTGKTYNITSLYIRALIEQELEVSEILVLTYTKAATAELKERILTRIRESAEALRRGKAGEDGFLKELLIHTDDHRGATVLLERALRGFDEAAIFTIHGFCQRALQEQAFLSGVLFDSELVADDSDLIRESVDDRWRRLVGNAESESSERYWLHILRDEGLGADTLAEFASAAIGKPYLDLLHDPPMGESREQEVEALHECYQALKRAWNGNRDEIEDLLLSEPMNGNRYRSTSVPGWLDELDQWFRIGLPTLQPIEKFDRFAIDFIRENGTRKNFEPIDHPFFHLVRSYIDQAWRTASWIPPFKREIIEETRQQVRKRKLEQGLFGFDDLLVLLHEALSRKESGQELAGILRKDYPLALVDEFQDTDPVQYGILSRIYRESEDEGLFLIGDPKQSIYSFRGADIFSYIRAREAVDPDNTYGLGFNYRSEPNLIKAINPLFSRLDAPFLVPEIKFSPVEPAEKPVPEITFEGKTEPRLRFLRSKRFLDSGTSKKEAVPSAAELTAESIAQLLNRGAKGEVRIGDKPVRARDVAVLVRSHKQADRIREALERRKVKSVQYSEKSVFETAQARDMELLLRAVAEPGSERAIRTVLASELFPHTAMDLLNLQEEEHWREVAGQFRSWNRRWNSDGFAGMFRAFMLESGAEQHLVGLDRGERKLTNTLQLGELLQQRAREAGSGPYDLLQWLAGKRRDPDQSAEEEQLRLESDAELVRIVTMHRSKGLEYPVVYCPFLWAGSQASDSGQPLLFHDRERENRPSMDLNRKGNETREQRLAYAAEESLSEDLRLAYVALTRAQHLCTVILDAVSQTECSPLGYLLTGRRGYSADHGEYLEKLEALAEDYPDLITLESGDERTVTPCTAGFDSTVPNGEHRQYTRQQTIQSRAIVSSFSSIMHPGGDNSGSDPALNDEFFQPAEPVRKAGERKRSIFTFPRGAQAGSCVHAIFEDIDFSGNEPPGPAIESRLQQYGFDRAWRSVLEGMIDTVLEKKLTPGVRLGDLERAAMLQEMEFYFDMEEAGREELLELIRGEAGDSGAVRLPGGFMKGYIDLVFRQGGRYYILDYKTNHLGDSPSDYDAQTLRHEMQSAGYDIQYHIYTLALHRYLQRRLPDYDYERHFGGALYLFLRGMEPEGSNGIYYHKPDRQTIMNMDRLFAQQGETDE